jgi:hypothetical protein
LGGSDRRPAVGDPMKKGKEYERNVLYRAELTGRFFFAPKVCILSPTIRLVVGKKYDVTGALQPYLLKKFRRTR